MPESASPKPVLVEAGRYRRRRQAEERGLVVAAMGCSYQIERAEDGAFSLLVYERNLDAVSRELDKFELENAGQEDTQSVDRLEKIPTASLYLCSLMMGAFFLIQKTGPAWWEDAGIASSEAMVRHGEWWRALTALTLHGDFSHLAANLVSGLIFAAFVIPLLGTGWTWMLIVASGGIGNLINAYIYRSEPHFSLGASTAVFGALGILTAYQTLNAIRSIRRVRLWKIILPFGAGLALLAYLGTGDEHTDLLAHFWGFGVGLILGCAANLLHLKKRTPASVQRLLATFAVAAPFVAWLSGVV